MDTENLKNLINQQIEEKFKSFSNLPIPQHQHNGSDSLRIKPEDLLPYQIGTIPNSANGYGPVANGNISAYGYSDYLALPLPVGKSWDWGYLYKFNNTWFPLNMADFKVSAQGQNAAQTITSGSTATIKFDSFVTQTPTGFYVPATGIWSLPSTSWYIVDALVTMTAGGTTSGTFEIAVSDGPITKTVTYPASDTEQTLHISVIMPGTLLSGCHITVKNGTPNSRSTSGGIDNTVLTIKQLK